MTPPLGLNLNRRDFLTKSAAATALAAASSGAIASADSAIHPRTSLPKSATDTVTLGKSGVKVSLVGMGTGSVGTDQASNQTRKGVKEFTRVVRHALDRGIHFFDVADQYGSHVYLREALKGVPRDQYVIQTKTHAHDASTAKTPHRALLPRAGRRLHRHPPPALHDRWPLAGRRTPGRWST